MFIRELWEFGCNYSLNMFSWNLNCSSLPKDYISGLWIQLPRWLIIREMQIKTTVRYHFILVRMGIIKKTTNEKCCWVREGKGALLHRWWERRLVQPLWKTEEVSQKLKNRTMTWFSNSTPRYISKQNGNNNLKGYEHPNMYSSPTYNSQDMELTCVH